MICVSPVKPVLNKNFCLVDKKKSVCCSFKNRVFNNKKYWLELCQCILKWYSVNQSIDQSVSQLIINQTKNLTWEIWQASTNSNRKFLNVEFTVTVRWKCLTWTDMNLLILKGEYYLKTLLTGFYFCHLLNIINSLKFTPNISTNWSMPFILHTGMTLTFKL